MEWLQGRIEVYHSLFLWCVGIFITGTAASIVLYIKFRIGHMLGIKSGRAMKKTVKQWEETWEKQEKRSREAAVELLGETYGEEETEALEKCGKKEKGKERRGTGSEKD